MAKIKKEKFNVLGIHIEEQTTSKGEIELDLYYSGSHDFFHFDDDEISKKLNIRKGTISFSGCKTKQSAIDVIRFFIDKSFTKKRFIKISINTNKDIYCDKKVGNYSLFESNHQHREGVPDYVYEMFSSFGHKEQVGLSLEFERVLKIECNNTVRYIDCKDNWEYDSSLSNNRIHYSGLIEWTLEIESFLLTMQQQLNSMSKKVFEYFSEPTIEKLSEKIGGEMKLLIAN